MMDNEMMLVPLRQDTVSRLFACRNDTDKSLDSVLIRLILEHPGSACRVKDGLPTTRLPPRSTSGGYRATLHGQTIAADSLRELLANVLNQLAEMDDRVLCRFSAVQGRTRRHVAQSREAIHPGRSDLNRRYTVEFRPGWWVGTNYSAADVRRILRDACQTASISFGHDLSVEL